MKKDFTDDFFKREEEILQEKELEAQRNREIQEADAKKLGTKVLSFIVNNAFFIFLFGFLWAVVLYYYFLCDHDRINVHEKRLYIFLFLLMVAVICFGVLRLYNAVVANSGLLLSMRNGLDSYTMELKKIHATFSTTVMKLHSASTNLFKVVKAFTTDDGKDG